MNRLKDLDVPIEAMAASIRNLENGKEHFTIAIAKVVKHMNEVEDILIDIQKNLTGESLEVLELLKKTDILNQLSARFEKMLDLKEAEFMNIAFQKPTPILPS
jgi:hypothetical protein